MKKTLRPKVVKERLEALRSELDELKHGTENWASGNSYVHSQFCVAVDAIDNLQKFFANTIIKKQS